MEASPPADRYAIELTDSFLSNHTALREVFRSDASRDVGGQVDCADGDTTMRALSAEGASIRMYNEYSRDTFVTYENATYQLLLTFAADV